MNLYSQNDSYELYQGNMLDMLDVIESNSIDSIVTDPPYELNFMSKGWDNAGVSFQPDTWRKCYEVLKPGGYLLAFGGSRTFHRIACAIEDAGFEIRDTIMWLYGSGFPKSMDISKQIDKHLGIERQIIGKKEKRGGMKATFGGGDYKESALNITEPATDLAKQWQGWGTALKPSFEPIIVARKPFKGSLVDNVIENGVGGINIDECRVKTTKEDCKKVNRLNVKEKKYNTGMFHSGVGSDISNGRFPANTILTYDENDFDEVCGGFPNTKNATKTHIAKNSDNNVNFNASKDVNVIGYNDNGSASRYFYCAKASKKDRDEGLEDEQRNVHPTVKPTSLMQYLVRLVTPNGGTILDPFNGSGSTGKAVMYENKERNKNYKYIGIELTEEYLPIAKARIEHVCKLIEEKKNKERQMSIYEI